MKVHVLALSLALAASGCGRSKGSSSGDSPPPVGGGEGGDNSGDATQVQALQMGAVSSIKGDVAADEGGGFSLTQPFSFSLVEDSMLIVRKDMANGNCGAPTGDFLIFAGEEMVDHVQISPDKTYEGFPMEVFNARFGAGDYMLIAVASLGQECKGQMFFYDFVLDVLEEESP